MPTTRLAIVSDTHLSSATPEADANWDAVVRHVEETRPDLVLHLGDLSLDGAHRAADLDHARAQLDRLPVEWRAVPGNHDVGDNPWPGLRAGGAVDAERHGRWLDVIGPDHWTLRCGPWTLPAINAQLLGAELEAAEAQWAWLDGMFTRGLPGRTVLVSHKPWAAPEEELAATPPYRFVPPAARARLAEIAGHDHPTLVVSGHVHQHRELRLSGTHHIWAPTTWAVLPDDVQPPLGTKRCALLSLDLHDGRRATAHLVEPGGMSQHTLLRDIPNPYRH